MAVNAIMPMKLANLVSGAMAIPPSRPVYVRGVAQPGRAPGSGPGGRRFKSSLPDQSFQTLKVHFWFSAYSAVDDFVDGEIPEVNERGKLSIRLTVHQSVSYTGQPKINHLEPAGRKPRALTATKPPTLVWRLNPFVETVQLLQEPRFLK